MARTYKDSPHSKQGRDRGGRGRTRNISVRSVRRDPPDLSKLSRAVIALAMAQADAEAQAAADAATAESDSPEPADDR
jgi:hypothetical protein